MFLLYFEELRLSLGLGLMLRAAVTWNSEMPITLKFRDEIQRYIPEIQFRDAQYHRHAPNAACAACAHNSALQGDAREDADRHTQTHTDTHRHRGGIHLLLDLAQLVQTALERLHQHVIFGARKNKVCARKCVLIKNLKVIATVPLALTHNKFGHPTEDRHTGIPTQQSAAPTRVGHTWHIKAPTPACGTARRDRKHAFAAASAQRAASREATREADVVEAKLPGIQSLS